jgi:hypothetical protein
MRGELRFPLTLDAGRYRVWARARASLPTPGAANSFFLQWDAQPAIEWHLPTETTWRWTLLGEYQAGTPIETSLEAGAHVLTIRGRESGSAIDALAITADPGWHPHAGGAGPTLQLEAEDAVTIVAPFVVRDEPGASREFQVRWLYPQGLVLGRDVYRGRDGGADGGYLRDHPRLRAQVQATDPVFMTILYPSGAGPDPGTSAEVSAGRARVTVTWRGAVDLIDVALEGASPPRFVRAP